MSKKLIIIVGPTAIGKTQISIELAKSLNSEIISCDSRQVYKELVIGTAPPTKDQLLKIKHHFIQNISITENYNAGIFEKDAIKKINTINNNIIIAVGGSGLYIDAICKGFDNIPSLSGDLRIQLNNKYKTKGLSWLQEKVKEIDNDFYKKNDINNPRRLLRALEVYMQTGKKISSFRKEKKKERPFKIIKIGLKMNRSMLYKKINQRVDIMINSGLVDEASKLLKYKNYNALKTVGYTEIFQYLNKEIDLETAINNIKQNTRRFAKRQLTWFRKDSEITWFEPTDIQGIKEFIELS